VEDGHRAERPAARRVIGVEPGDRCIHPAALDAASRERAVREVLDDGEDAHGDEA
jgi:Ni2+-binding GTPase involved in maturation of urease and hydrogenase